MRSFVGNTLAPEHSRGFHHRKFDRRDILGASESMAPFTFVAMAGLPHFPPVAYALFSPERAAGRILTFGLTGKHVNFLNGFVFDPTWEKVGLW
jgi:hypothetical protein